PSQTPPVTTRAMRRPRITGLAALRIPVWLVGELPQDHEHSGQEGRHGDGQDEQQGPKAPHGRGELLQGTLPGFHGRGSDPVPDDSAGELVVRSRLRCELHHHWVPPASYTRSAKSSRTSPHSFK